MIGYDNGAPGRKKVDPSSPPKLTMLNLKHLSVTLACVQNCNRLLSTHFLVEAHLIDTQREGLTRNWFSTVVPILPYLPPLLDHRTSLSCHTESSSSRRLRSVAIPTHDIAAYNP